MANDSRHRPRPRGCYAAGVSRSPRPTRSTALAALAWTVAVTGCAEPAPGVLEVAIETPPSPWDGDPPDGRRYHLFVQFRPATAEWPLESSWSPDPRDPRPIALPSADECAADPTRCRFTFSVLSDRTDIDLNVKVRFCLGQTPDSAYCEERDEATQTSGRYVILEHPFYPGKRTWWNMTFESIPQSSAPSTLSVDKCDVAGCSEDAGWNWDGRSRNYCLRASGKHFCEEP